jgi:uncharacterized protein YjbI with pentapeptide repeats
MKRRFLVLAAVLGVVVASCADNRMASNPTAPAANATTIADEQQPTTTVAETPATTTTVESTTTTTMPTTTTTVLDIACIKTTTCQYSNLVGVDFSRLKLDFINFSVAQLAGASFVGANLSNSILIRADLSAVNFEGATLKNTDFTAANLTDASFKGANLEGAVLCDVDLAVVLDLTKEQLEKVKKFKPRGKVYCP